MNNYSLKEKIKINYSSLSKSEKLVADFILNEEEIITHLTLAEFAEKVSVSEPTIIRFTKSIGLKGFTNLKLLAMRDLGTLATEKTNDFYLHNFDISPDDDLKDIPQIIYNKTKKSIKDTFQLIDIESFLNIANSIKTANLVEIIASGNSGAIAYDFMSKLVRVGINARHHPDNHLQDLNVLGLNENDVLFAITHSGTTTDLIKTVKLAKSLNITTIVLTNFKTSKITKYADHVLYTGDFEASFLSETMTSRLSQLMLIDMIYSAIIIDDYSRISKHLEKVNTIVEKKNL